MLSAETELGLREQAPEPGLQFTTVTQVKEVGVSELMLGL